ncbi:MAG TPA: R3H domain-containing nucleic acid-binding protein [Thermoanaerobaculia bacterium]|jgi:predicted RNA-binding protein Jag
MSQRFEGRNLEDALQQAAQTYGVERWQLTYHVLLEKRGFLGGMKRVVIEAEINAAAAPEPQPAAPVSAPAPAAVSPDARPSRLDRPMRVGPRTDSAPSSDRGPRGGGGGGGGRGGRGGSRDGGRSRDGGGGGGRGRGGPRGDRGGPRAGGPRGGGGRELRTGDFETFLGDVPEQTPESDAAKAVREWLETVFFLAKIDVVVRTEENDTQVNVKLYGADSGRLTEHHGELLDAIQVLANKALTGRKVEKEIELDCEGFKHGREEDLARRALEAADRVRKGGREELLPSMSPIERRIVHIALRDDADVTTDSRGEGFFKRVAIILRPAGEAAGEPAESAPSSDPA